MQVASDAARASGWLADLDAYLAAPGHASGDPQRDQLVAAVQADPVSPEAWLAFLSAEDAAAGNMTAPLPAGADGGSGGSGVSLYHLYFWATQLVPRSKNQSKEAYIMLWLGYAKQQWCGRAAGRAPTPSMPARAPPCPH